MPLRRFVTRADLARLGLDALLGSPLLRPYMHGFFVDARLHAKAVAAAAPCAYEEHRAQRIAAKMEEERQGRISVVRKLPKACTLLRRHVLTVAQFRMPTFINTVLLLHHNHHKHHKHHSKSRPHASIFPPIPCDCE